LATLAVASSIGVVVGCASGAGTRAVSAPARIDPELDRIEAAVARALTASPPRGYAAVPPGVRLLSIARGDGRAIVMDFNDALAAQGRGRVLEDALHQVFTAASSVRPAEPRRVDDYRVLIHGVPLDAYLR
jgi:hypothetical protein